MIPGIGTLINSFAVIGVGVLTRFFVKKEIKNFENNLLPLGLLVLTLGIRESLKSPEFLLTLVAVLIGAIIGSYLRIEERIKSFGEYLHNKFEKDSSEKSKFIESYLTASLIVVTGPLAIVGPFLDVVEGNIELLLIKTALDCFLVLISNFKWWKRSRILWNFNSNLSRILYVVRIRSWGFYRPSCSRFNCRYWWSFACRCWNKSVGIKANTSW